MSEQYTITVAALQGPPGRPGTSLTRRVKTIQSVGGSAVINLAEENEFYILQLTENTTISFSGLPADGLVADVRVRIIQNGDSAKACAFTGTSVKTARGAAWSVSTVLSATEDVGVSIDSAGNLTLYPSGVLV